MLQAGNGWLIATLGEGQEKEREEERGRRRKGERAEGERARPAATFQRVIIVISLGGLDSVVLSREGKKERELRKDEGREKKRHRGVMERSGEKWEAHKEEKEKNN